MLTLDQFVAKYNGRGAWSRCTGNQAAGIKPQCVDGISLWSENLGKGCFPRRGNAKDIFANADPNKWRKVRNAASNIPPAGAIVVFGARPGNPYGHVAIALPGCTATTVFSFDQNWSLRNRFSRERHAGYTANNVIGWLIRR